MDLKEKYGEWGIVLGATEGVGEAFCKKLAEGGMNIVMVGRREELMREKAEKFKAEYGVDYKVVRADLSEPDEACEKIFAATEDLDMGFMSYVACLHHFGRFQEVDLETHEKCLNVNVISFLRIFHHYMQEFAAKDRGAVINVSSMTGISGSPFNGEYGAGKAYILKLTEAVAYETKKTGVDVEAITLGTTLTPTAMKNFPKGPAGDAVVKIALTPDQVAEVERLEQRYYDPAYFYGSHSALNRVTRYIPGTGTVGLAVTVGPDGTIAALSVSGDFMDPDAADVLCDAVRGRRPDGIALDADTVAGVPAAILAEMIAESAALA